MTDAAGKKRAVAKDALGDISAVTEDPDRLNYTTLYGFNVLDELERVVQGTQTRTFVYDSLKRLTQATNPESGTVSYTYDNAGNLQTKTDSRGITTTYSHDCLNRLFHRASSDLSVDTWYTYDETAFANSTGRLTQVGEGSVLITYGDADAMGRVLHSSEQTSTQTYNFSYSYNLAGALTSEQYPSARTIYTCYDGANRVSLVSKADGCQQNVPANYVNNVIYWPHGAPNTYSYGNNLQTVAQYNNRLQPVTLYANLAGATNGYLFQQQFCWTPEGCPNTNTDNNGNLGSIHTLAGGPDALANLPVFDQSFTYDGVNRLTAASDSGGWSRGFTYDPVGNMWVDPARTAGIPLAGNTPTSNVYNGNNQIVSGTYDSAGNQLVVNGDAILYDAENRQVQVNEAPGMGGGQVNYSYDGNGQRVQKVVASGPTTVYVYDAFGQLAAEYSSGSTQAAPCTTCYLTYDHLGSVRLVTDENGTVVARHDYLPFGEEIPGSAAGRNSQWGSGTDTVSQKFTGQERDQDTGLDYFQARYFGSALGRFTSPDPANIGADLTNPQSWNAYAYVANNPLNAVDPSGMVEVDCNLWECGGGGGYGPNPLDPCAFFSTSDASCQGPPTNFPDGTPIGGGGGTAGGGSGTTGGSSSGTCSQNGDPIPCPAPSYSNLLFTSIFTSPIVFSTTVTSTLPKNPTQPLQPTKFRVAVPFWQNPLPRYCGPGTGSGAPVNQVDAACQAHDQCYQNAGVTGADIFKPGRGPLKTAAINACDAQLCKRLTTIVPESRTENGDAFFVGWFFSVTHGSMSVCIP